MPNSLISLGGDVSSSRYAQPVGFLAALALNQGGQAFGPVGRVRRALNLGTRQFFPLANPRDWPTGAQRSRLYDEVHQTARNDDLFDNRFSSGQRLNPVIGQCRIGDRLLAGVRRDADLGFDFAVDLNRYLDT